ncbi:MAG: hypothetical protein IPM77_07690 [Crocinitomicaceae bacterium]|nr:hypothetical protein [Crocinitomicaceae bacterium]
MKIIFLSTFLLPCSTFFCQKPKNTFAHTEFAKQVVLGIAYSMDGSYIDYNSQQYIISKTGKSAEEVTEMAAAYKASCEKDLVEIRNQKLPIVVGTVDVIVLQESPMKTADIVIHSTYNNRMIDLHLKNCIQTDRTWVLGDHILATGDGVEAPVTNSNNNESSGLANAIQNSNEKEESIKGTSIEVKGYQGTKFAQSGNDVSSQYIRHDQIGYPLKGYVVSSTGVKTEAVIVYQEPEKLLSSGFDLAICKEANNQKPDILNPQSEPNFASWLNKKDLRAFFVGDQLFFQAMPGKWYILMSEGAIRKLVTIEKITSNGVSSYTATEWVQKLNNEPTGTAGMFLNFKNSMSSLVNENSEMAEKISLKEEGYQRKNFERLVKEFNLWYDQQSGLPSVNYVFDVEGAAKPVVNNVSENTTTENTTTENTTTENITTENTNATDNPNVTSDETSSGENQSLPAGFESLISAWSFSAAILNGKDKSNMYLDDEGWLGGNPREMTFHGNGSLTYDDFFVQKKGIVSATWQLMKSENEDGTVSYSLWIENITSYGTTVSNYTNFLIKDGVMTFVYLEPDVKYTVKQ